MIADYDAFKREYKKLYDREPPMTYNQYWAWIVGLAPVFRGE